VLAAAAAAGLWYITAPTRLQAETFDGIQPGDAGRGERVFWAAGCAACHARPDAEDEARPELAGGVELKTPFGTFVAPNISPDPEDGIGNWTEAQFADAVMRGVAPDGSHYYPAFPYPSYARMKPQDVADLFAFLKTLPAVKGRPRGHVLSFPFNIRRGIGLWKYFHMHDEPVIALPADASEAVRRGQYLVEGPGHCGECHTPRLFTGGLDYDQWLAGAEAFEGKGIVPNITPSAEGLESWSESDIAYFLESGFTPDFDSVGGSMAEVQKNMAHLPAEDREAIAAYLKAIPPRPNGYAAKPAGEGGNGS